LFDDADEQVDVFITLISHKYYHMAERDEHIIKCSICKRGLIVKDIVNDGVAFLSHLKIDHAITYIPQRMTEEQTKSKRDHNQLQIE
jgi:hypothetical protein